ncbi:Trehalose-phosphate synthase [Gemmata obscuriglobus]|uniref:Trehalose-6-phosphate synthase n=1 Tax=Gemmata obscuriglobus TaxID=114 RepID=A0A2Z3H6I6_9BACT|nr:trehalose-6-phosphate synthase [Gemmata obscuriglobus]AWM38645.1 trehalose-6-phosphate synthase [Gemmata obscuriglobus]QEG28396.1 Trehalose-phosphate synthase [Gemmata obscuriglobus]VTS06329.1 -trehalose-phosphate synthase : Alpha,alpha-trehalose-phosphate synthase (UDP-forming) OS=candidate division ZIXI bacterium RBG-1 GN=RBG1_1C00001G0655 PE=4 SV=1: Glyco_transf_20 [Gemmata obscuriglobus UQM 2246]
MGWTKERLQEVARTRLGGAKLIVVANREPYIHRYATDGAVEWIRPAGGLTTALDPVMQACGGVWVAHGSGDADRAVTDPSGRVGVPPDDPNYVLRRVWLTPEQEDGYYYGAANGMLWPLCHQVFARPAFDPGHWDAYRRVNQTFADAVLEEAQGGPALVFIQDYHFALLPRLLKAARPDLVTAQFWHIPWPGPEKFLVCPWARDILDGLLGNDLMGFHTQHDCNHFLECVDRALECRIDRERFAVQRGGQATTVKPFPISVDPALADEYLGDDWAARAGAIRRRHGLGDRPLIVGVDRVDYTKGIPERLRAVDRVLHRHPELKGGFHFVQVGAPSRSSIPAYRDLTAEVNGLAARINREHGTAGWQPVVFLNAHHGPEDIFALYRDAAGCVVSSLHDGMNLVAKEFVTARADDRGVLVLSTFTGAARELTDAVLANPFDVDELADGLYAALTMPAAEQERRMRRMRAQVDDHNIYRWAGSLLTAISKMVPDVADAASEPTVVPDPADESLDATERDIARENYFATLRLAAG